ncbi:MAG TPA: tetratricopeptide repeat protein, partial [Candidatus Binataceae bacterium]|nr:tetratricopeptide repeat protein [Candidatus Binataceae bacterium]
SAPATRANSPTERAGDALGAMWPYALAVVGYLALRLWVLGFVSEPYRGYHLSAGQALLTIPSAVATYLLLLVMPWRAGPAHRLDPVGSFATLGFIVPVAAFVALCGAGFIALRNNPRRRIYLFGAAWIPIALAPMLNLNGLLAQAVVQDRYLYLPSFGFCLIVADFAVAYARSNETSAQAVWIGAGVLLAALAVILFRTEAFWHDDVAMFSDFVTKFPNVDAWHYQLGKALATRGDFARARGEIETAVNLAPNASAAVLHDLATVDAWLGDRGAAMRAMDTALKRDPNPSADAYAEFALAADAAGDSNASDAALRRAGEIPGGDEIAALTRAQIRFRHGDRAGAESDLKSVFVRDPDNERALVTLGAVLSSEHRYDEALAIYQRAARLPVYDPSLHYLTALVLHHLGRDGESRSECAAALEAAPDDAAANRLMSELEGGAAPR